MLEIFKLVLYHVKKLYLHTVAASIIFVALYLYLLFPFYLLRFDAVAGYYLENSIHFTVLRYGAVFYTIYHWVLIQTAREKTKLELFLEGVKKQQFTAVDWRNMRYALVKFFFIPILLPATVIYVNLVVELVNKPIVYEGFIPFFNQFVFNYVIYIVSFVSLAFYVFGYLFESKKLKSEVKSVDNTVLGWTVTLICYAPFFVILTQYIPFPTQDYAYFINKEITFVVRIILSLVMLFKMYVIILLGAKCSNLTNRGIVTTGAYRYVRHPHYLAKLIVWWITFLPFLIYNYWAIGPMVFWTVIYVLRAITEEKHLSKDPAYLVYKQQVKWLFIPKVF